MKIFLKNDNWNQLPTTKEGKEVVYFLKGHYFPKKILFRDLGYVHIILFIQFRCTITLNISLKWETEEITITH